MPRPPAPPHTHSKEKCPRPAVFLLSAFAIEYPLALSFFLLPRLMRRNLDPKLRRTDAEKPDTATQPSPNTQPRPSRPPPSLPGGDRSASFGQAGTPHPRQPPLTDPGRCQTRKWRQSQVRRHTAWQTLTAQRSIHPEPKPRPLGFLDPSAHGASHVPTEAVS